MQQVDVAKRNEKENFPNESFSISSRDSHGEFQSSNSNDSITITLIVSSEISSVYVDLSI